MGIMGLMNSDAPGKDEHKSCAPVKTAKKYTHLKCILKKLFPLLRPCLPTALEAENRKNMLHVRKKVEHALLYIFL